MFITNKNTTIDEIADSMEQKIKELSGNLYVKGYIPEEEDKIIFTVSSGYRPIEKERGSYPVTEDKVDIFMDPKGKIFNIELHCCGYSTVVKDYFPLLLAEDKLSEFLDTVSKVTPKDDKHKSRLLSFSEFVPAFYKSIYIPQITEVKNKQNETMAYQNDEPER